MLLPLVYAFWIIMSPTDGFSCNVTKDGKTASIIYFQNKCYLFGNEKQSYGTAYNFCSNNNGVLTDVDENFEILIEKCVNETTRLDDNYWIGLFWTSHWESYIWASGNNNVKPKTFKENIKWIYGYCVKFSTSSSEFENDGCSEKFAPICMFQINGNVTDNEKSQCQHVCQTVQGTYGKTTTTVTTTIVTTASNLGTDNTTTSPATTTAIGGNVTSKTCICTGCDVTRKTCICTGFCVTNKTCICTECEVTSKTCTCTECPCDSQLEDQTKTPLVGQEESVANMTSLVVLAALLSVSILVNVIAFVVLFRMRFKNHSGIKRHKPVPMVDILSVDSQSLNQTTTNPATRYTNQETRVGYGIYADTDEETHGYQEMDIKMSMAKQIKTDLSKEVTSDLDSQPYSHLNRDGGQPTKSSEADQVYGPESVMAATSTGDEVLSPSSKHENCADGNNLYSNYDSSL